MMKSLLDICLIVLWTYICRRTIRLQGFRLNYQHGRDGCGHVATEATAHECDNLLASVVRCTAAVGMEVYGVGLRHR